MATSSSKLRLNTDKTEFIISVYGSTLSSPCLHMFRVSVKVILCNSVTSDMSGGFTYDASVPVANALISSQLDNCNSLSRSLSEFNQCKLQCIQNSAARIVSNTSAYVTCHFKTLGCFKTVIAVFKWPSTSIFGSHFKTLLGFTCGFAISKWPNKLVGHLKPSHWFQLAYVFNIDLNVYDF